MKKLSIILLMFIVLFSCENKFPDYIKKEPGVYMKLVSFGEANKKTNMAAYVSVAIEILAPKGLLYKRYKEDLIDLTSNEFNFLTKHLGENDSCVFMVSRAILKNKFGAVMFNKTSSDFFKVSMKIHNYYTKKEYLSQGYDKEMMEQLILKKYLREVDAQKYQQGIYIQQLRKGKGKKITTGDAITISYKGYFVNRLEFDNISGSTAFTFTYGTPDQIIKGLDVAINGMKKGEKSKIIIPSQLAFGEEGSTTHLVPPYTTVIYELEIVNVN